MLISILVKIICDFGGQNNYWDFVRPNNHWDFVGKNNHCDFVGQNDFWILQAKITFLILKGQNTKDSQSTRYCDFNTYHSFSYIKWLNVFVKFFARTDCDYNKDSKAHPNRKKTNKD